MSSRAHRNALPGGYRLFWYRIERVLGQGSFGITYLTTDLNLHQEVAVKEYLPVDLAVREEDSAIHPTTDDRYEMYSWGLTRFMREARALAQFKHPNIVRVHSVFEANNTAYMVMDYEEGKSLAAYLSSGRPRTEAELRNLLFLLLDGLEHLHEAGFVHRDIKPANIYVRANGTPVLLDFGSARLAIGTQTHTLTSLVTAGYAPFEQYGEGGKQGPWTDIYALGATLYTAMTGCAPVDAMQRSYARLGGKPDPLEPATRVGRGRFSERFLYAVQQAMRFLPEERPQSVAEWRQMFMPPQVYEQSRESVATEPMTSMPPPPPRRESSPERHRAVPFFREPVKLGLIVALLVTVVVTALWMHKRGQRPMDSASLPETVEQPQYVETPVAPRTPGQQTDPEREPPDQQVSREEPREAPAQEELPVEQEPLPVEVTSPPEEREQRQRENEIAALLEKADRAWGALRLTTPAGDNALEYYQSVLAFEPEHPEAQQGLQRIVARYVELADRALGESNFDKAEAYLGRAQGILPEAEEVLTEAHDRLVEARKISDEEQERLAELERQREEELQKQRAEETERTAALERQRKEEEARSRPGAIFRDTLQDGSQGPEMVVIPAGSFMMGSPESEEGRYSNEGPQHRVTIASPFALGRYEVTFDEYDHFAKETGRKLPSATFSGGRGTRPVINVTWSDAITYTGWLSYQTGEKYRLPSEAEWEYGARAGTTARYWWGDDAGSNRARCSFCGDGYSVTAPVGSFTPNPFGLYDTAGNVWEWTQDCWNGNYEGAPSDGSVWLSTGCSNRRRVIRGGSWLNLARKARSANRTSFSAKNNNLGFRIARDL